MCASVVLACIPVPYVSAWCPGRPAESTGSPGTGVRMAVYATWVQEIKPGSPGRAVRALKDRATPPAHQLHF